jgi:hypothetical protein
MRRVARRRVLWAALFAVAIGVLVLLLVLIGIGYLRLSTSSSSGNQVTISAVHWSVEQGTNAAGSGWFGKSQFNYTGSDGWVPPTFAAGSELTVNWAISNFDTVEHNISAVSVGSPFVLAGTHPTLPMVVIVGDDGGTLGVIVTTPSSLSGSFVLDITVDALG